MNYLLQQSNTWVNTLQSNLLTKLKKIFKPLERTILHPQWLSYRNQEILVDWLRQIQQQELVLDIGCADRWTEQYLSRECHYIGMDYFETAIERYNSTVDVYANAERLPFESQSLDAVIMFDVLEHIEDGNRAIKEVYRVLKPGGKVFIQIPFMYPIHDAPNDFRRPTKYELEVLFNQNNLELEQFGSRGKPLETALLLTNIALVKSMLNGFKNNKLLSLLFVPFVGVASVVFNCLGWFVSKAFVDDDLMPFSYHALLRKNM